MQVRQYDPGEVNFSVGQNDVVGYAKDSFIKCARNVDQATLSVGADGEATVSRSRNRSGRITVMLQQSSPLNDIFSAMADAWEAGTGGTDSALVKDGNGTSLASAKTAWIVKRPELGFAAESGDREWIFETNNLVLTVGGENTL